MARVVGESGPSGSSGGIDGKPHTTRTGRVVYDRRLHLFTVRDALRIINRASFHPDSLEDNQVVLEIVGVCADRLRSTAVWAFRYAVSVSEATLRFTLKQIIFKFLDIIGQTDLDERAREAYQEAMNLISSI